MTTAEIGLPTGCQFFSVDSEEERDEWVESIRRCSVSDQQLQVPILSSTLTPFPTHSHLILPLSPSLSLSQMGQGAGKPVATTAAPAAKKEVAYRTVLVGGKVQKIPVQVCTHSAALLKSIRYYIIYGTTPMYGCH